jgi:signal transduction histidine kinase
VDKILSQALGQDVSQLAATEKRLLLSRLFARLAHEIRNPLSSLDLHLQLLDEDLTSIGPEVRPRVAGQLDVIHAEVRRLNRIVQQFLNLSGPSSLALESVDLSAMLAHVRDLLTPEAQNRQIELRLRLGERMPRIMADSVQLSQAFMNLVINALQAVDRSGWVAVEAEQVPGEVRIAVLDSGPGLPAERLEVLFEPYFTTKREGSGLGLWIAQQIVAAHGGDIQAQNSQAGGAIFIVRLPCRS